MRWNLMSNPFSSFSLLAKHTHPDSQGQKLLQWHLNLNIHPTVAFSFIASVSDLNLTLGDKTTKVYHLQCLQHQVSKLRSLTPTARQNHSLQATNGTGNTPFSHKSSDSNSLY
ncbi:hypothetical protein GQ457_16G008200 [Hibiscus cannabinus]